MYEITIEVSNDTVLNGRHEIQKFLEFENDRMAGGNQGEGHATASSGYILLRKLANAIDAETERRANQGRQQKVQHALRGPSVRELRRVAGAR